MNKFGFVSITCASTRTAVANPVANADEVIGVLEQVPDSDIVLFPELCVTGYTCADLFGQAALLEAGAPGDLPDRRGDARGGSSSSSSGCRCRSATACTTAAVAIADGQVLGVVPKQFIPNYKEFYESRWFRPADGREPARSTSAARTRPVRHRPAVRVPSGGRRSVGVEICEDLWMPIPPSSVQAVAGATILLNLSASNETIGKSRYRTDLVVGQSGRCIAAYAYAGAGPTESTTDLVFGGHCLIAENGRLLEESPRVGDGGPIRRDSYWITQDVDVAQAPGRPPHRRPASTTAASTSRPFRRIPFDLPAEMRGPEARACRARRSSRAEGPELHRRCAEIFGIQCAGLAKRIEQLPGRHAAEYRHLRRARLDAGAAGRRQDVRPAGHRPRD